MANLPAPISEFIDALTDELLAPAYMLVSDDGRLFDWGGALDSYGMVGLQEQMPVADHFPFLVGVLPVDAGGVFLPHVQLRDEVFADVYFFHRDSGTWILFLDATTNVKKRQALQQRTYDMSLRAADLEQEGKALYDVNSMLEQRVREQTAELSQTVRRLQEELAETKRTHRALNISETRFQRLYESDLVGIVFWNAGGTITDANDAFLKMIGYSKEDLASGVIRMNQISPPKTTPTDVPALERTMDTLSNKSDEREFVRKDGRPTRLQFIVGPYEVSSKLSVGFAAKPRD